MKSVERHKLETNWLAKRLETGIDDARPYFPTIVGAIIAAVIILFAWTWLSGASSGHEQTAWDTYNGIVGHTSLNQNSVKQLSTAAEEFQGTSMEEMARITAADGQVWAASVDALFDRKAATDALNSASSTYQSIIDSSSNEELIDRAHFGLGRVFELRNEPEKARQAYSKVTGNFARIAKSRADDLAKESTQKTLNWLATAEAQRPTAPLGAGTPGQRPLFGVEDFPLPNATSPGGTPAAPGTGTIAPGTTSIEELFKGVNQLPAGTDAASERYQTPEPEKGAATNTDAENKEWGKLRLIEPEKDSPVSPTDEKTPTQAPADSK
jgi:hypothetical protein